MDKLQSDVAAGTPGASATPTAEDIEAIKQAAHQAGLIQGIAEGRELGYAEGKADALLEAAKFKQLSESLEHAISDLDKSICAEVMDTALTLTQHLTRAAIHIAPELLLPVITEALAGLPASAHNIHIMLNPADAPLVHNYLEADIPPTFKVIPDESIARGGCKISSSVVSLDATLPARWARLAKSLNSGSLWANQTPAPDA